MNSLLNVAVRPLSPLPKTSQRKQSLNVNYILKNTITNHKPTQAVENHEEKAMIIKQQRAALWEKRSKNKVRLSKTPDNASRPPQEVTSAGQASSNTSAQAQKKPMGVSMNIGLSDKAINKPSSPSQPTLFLRQELKIMHPIKINKLPMNPHSFKELITTSN